MTAKVKITEKGTELPLLNLRGKPYLQVAHRLVWFRERFPDGAITTTILHHQNEAVVVRAEVSVRVEGNPVPQLLAVAHKMETKTSFPDYIEKAETGAIGRALAICGFGTQFEPEFDEADRLADAPIDIPLKADKANGEVTASVTELPKKMATFKRQAKVVEAPPVTTEDEL